MTFSITFALIAVLLSVGLDFYIYRKIRCIAPRNGRRWSAVVFVTFAALKYSSMLAALTLPVHSGGNVMLRAVMWFIFIFLSVFLAESLFVVVDALGSLPRLFGKRRLGWMTSAGITLGLIAFLVMWWGALINRFRISESHRDLNYSGLPASFENYRIVQISDVHVGTWGNDTTFLSRLVERVNLIRPDLIVMTGDIVNRRSDELEPMISTLSRLDAPDGVFAILGNHDYGDYYRWPSDSAQFADRDNLRRLYGLTGMRLLIDESVAIHRGADSIIVIGVGNISEPPFTTYGNLDISYPMMADSAFKILLSHDPSHWVRDIKDNPANNIALTLSGHTHAMQMQLAGITPAAMSCSTPWGLYADSLGRMLYVNRGIGTVGLPMRVGATPEISIFTLHRQ